MLVAVAATGGGLLAQEEVRQAKVKLDTPQAKVYSVIAHGEQPEDTLNRVLIFLDAGKIGKTKVTPGDVAWVQAGNVLDIEPATGEQFHMIEVELKNMPASPPPAPSKLDAVKVDSRHYKVVFENEQVRVLRVRYEAHEKGVLHEHTGNRIVCYLNDQGNMKAGDVRLAGPATHTEENTGDEPAERIAVELK